MEKNRAFARLEKGFVRAVFLGFGGEPDARGKFTQLRPILGITNDRQARCVVPRHQSVLRIGDEGRALPVVKDRELAANLGRERKRTMADRAPKIIIQETLPFFCAAELLLPSREDRVL